ncbi:MAG: hypothetical protein GX222_07890 [Ruminococcaceae bacterium]|nr:hypothetical protein [Oscillospiraceae bacterium]
MDNKDDKTTFPEEKKRYYLNQLLRGYKTKEMYDEEEDTILAAITRAPTPTDPVSQERIRQWKIKWEKIRPELEAEGIFLDD